MNFEAIAKKAADLQVYESKSYEYRECHAAHFLTLLIFNEKCGIVPGSAQAANVAHIVARAFGVRFTDIYN